MRKIKNILYWLIALAYFIISLSLVSNERHDTLCSEININIIDKNENFFINDKDILDRIQQQEIRLMSQPIEQIDLNHLEEIIAGHSSVNKVRVFRTIDGKVQIDIEQRKPIVRLINKFSGGYYIDENGNLMPLSTKYTAHVLPVSGNINEPYNTMKEKNITHLDDTCQSKKDYLLDDIFKIATFIRESDFWNAQIEQIYINDNNEFELVPKVGAHVIILGSPENFEEKFENLKHLYKRGLGKVGWNTYKTINLKYKNQIVCTKR